MSKNEYVLVQPVNIIVDDNTFDYGLVDGIYYPYMIMKKLEDGSVKDVVYGGDYKVALSGSKRIRELKSVEEVAFPPVKKIMDIEDTEVNRDFIALYIKNKGAIPEDELESSSSTLKQYMNRVDLASGKTEQMNSDMFKNIFAFTLGDIYNANMNACFELECSIERRGCK